MSFETQAKHNPRVSIIVPAYNVESYIAECLDSLLVDAANNCEVIVVNDGSTDGTGAVIATYVTDPRLRVVNQANGGLGEARNTGIENSRGDFLLFVDSDDWLEPDAMTCFEAALSETPKADILVFGFYEVYGDKRLARRCRADFWDITNSACNKLFHRNLFDGLRFEPGIWYEDLAIVPCLFARARHPKTLDVVLYNYRRDRDTSIMNTVDLERVTDLSFAALTCLGRIRKDESSGRIAPTRPRFGQDWQRRFLTMEIFIPGVLHRSRKIGNRATRRRYIAQMMAQIPSRRDIRVDVVTRLYGRKMGLGSALYRTGHNRMAHFVLHDTGEIKRWVKSRLGLGERAKTP